MKKLYTLLIAVILTASAMAQAPEKMSYQAVVRDAGNALVTSQAVGIQISILQGSVSGSAVYVETQTPTTNINGLVSLEIGSGTIVSGTFNTIDWSNGPYFIKTETDPTGGTTYTITGTSQLLSVPYALHAKTAENVTGGINETDPVYSAWNKSDDISITNSQVSDFQAGVSSNTDLVANTAKVTFPEAPNDGNEYVRKDEVWSVVTQSGVSDHSLLSNIGTNTHAQIDTHLSDGTVHFTQAGILITESQISDLGNYESAFAKNTAFNLNFGNSAGTVTEGNDSRLSDARTPTSHAVGHTDGSDDIQDAASSQKGLMTATYATKLDGLEAGAEANVNADWNASSGDAQILNKPADLTDLSAHNVTELTDISDAGSGTIISSAERTKLSGIETAADVTDATNVDAAGAVMESDFNAGTFLYATSNNTPQPKTVSETKAILGVETSIVGDIKQGVQAADHSGWIKLDGRSVSSLTATQQTAAATFGFTANLPDASNSYLVQDGNTLGSVNGSNSKTITQANLPNVNFTGTTSSDGSHTHTTTTNGLLIAQNPTSIVFGGFAFGGAYADTGYGSVTINSGGAHTHTVTASSGGSGTSLDITPKSLSVNTFIYLGN